MDEITKIVEVIDKLVNDPKVIEAVVAGRVRVEIGHKLVDPRDWRSIRPYAAVEPTTARWDERPMRELFGKR